MERSRILDIVYELIRELSEELKDEKKLNLNELSESTPLFGRDGSLDSLGLVNLVVGVEQVLMDQLNIEIEIANEKALSQARSPFKTVRSFVDYICSLSEDIS